MTQLLEQPQTSIDEPKTIEKVAIVISKGSLEGVYPGLIMANGARMEGIEADLFFTFLGSTRSARTATSTSRSRLLATPACTWPP
jgi:peroxiredoxin family protein